MKPKLPAATSLPRLVYSGHGCVFCGVRLSRGAVLAGRAEGMIGAHDMSTDVYACPACAKRFRLKAS